MDKELKIKRKRKLKTSSWIWGIILFFLASIFSGHVWRSQKEPLKPKPSNTKDSNWSSQSFGFASHPEDNPESIIQIYSARTRGTKKALAVHTWIATKRHGADHYKVSQILGWRLRRRGTALVSEPGIPDKSWYGNVPTLLVDLRGSEAEVIIDKIDLAINNYPWSNQYTLWPGPNSNTFIAWLGLEIPELKLDLPSTAIGKDWRPINHTIGYSASGSGIQASLFGLLGASIGYEEGLEVNILGLSIELDIFDLAIELPGFGRIGQSPIKGD